MNPCPKPTVGRIVHFVDAHNPIFHYAAIVIAVFDMPRINLVFWKNCGMQDIAESVPYDETGQQCFSWHWPERAD